MSSISRLVKRNLQKKSNILNRGVNNHRVPKKASEPKVVLKPVEEAKVVQDVAGISTQMVNPIPHVNPGLLQGNPKPVVMSEFNPITYVTPITGSQRESTVKPKLQTSGERIITPPIIPTSNIVVNESTDSEEDFYHYALDKIIERNDIINRNLYLEVEPDNDFVKGYEATEVPVFESDVIQYIIDNERLHPLVIDLDEAIKDTGLELIKLS